WLSMHQNSLTDSPPDTPHPRFSARHTRICVNRSARQTFYNDGRSPKRVFMRKFFLPGVTATFAAGAALVAAAGFFSPAA
ncbi:hypothetical protein, partial [Paraburkholderia sp. SIMBA_027]|uniref:hypothetical protein n=1 Tax=Paraburkholderia sp. SIMBA_027 TaxID=3085770 RepID=UPI00397C9023